MIIKIRGKKNRRFYAAADALLHTYTEFPNKEERTIWTAGTKRELMISLHFVVDLVRSVVRPRSRRRCAGTRARGSRLACASLPPICSPLPQAASPTPPANVSDSSVGLHSTRGWLPGNHPVRAPAAMHRKPNSGRGQKRLRARRGVTVPKRQEKKRERCDDGWPAAAAAGRVQVSRPAIACLCVRARVKWKEWFPWNGGGSSEFPYGLQADERCSANCHRRFRRPLTSHHLNALFTLDVFCLKY